MVNGVLNYILLVGRRKWLQTEGSPKSKISKCEFTNERFIADVEHHDFRVVK
jgi:hypothetical protein